MVTEIKFGTDGWRALIADEFTFSNVARCAMGLCRYLKERGTAERGLVVGYDTRFLSAEFASTVAGICAAEGIKVLLCDRPAPTPVVSYNVLHHDAAGAVIITASHNPAQWNGFKFKPEYAGSAAQDITDRLESVIGELEDVEPMPIKRGRTSELITTLDPAPPYLSSIAKQVNLDAIREAGFQVVVDAMFGAGGGYLPALLSGGNTIVEELHGQPNPAFPGMDQPEPIAQNLSEILTRVRAVGAAVGIALDGDADRVGIIDERGKYITTLNVFSLLALYLLENKERRGPLVKGVTSSKMLNKMGDIFGVDVHEMRVGFKNIGPKMTEVDALMAGEESGGFAFRGHIPERDGILSGLYFLEYMAVTGKTPAQLVKTLFDRVGAHYYHRRDVQINAEDRNAIQERVNNPGLDRVGEFVVVDSDNIDGRRLHFKDGWLAARFSGTEPLLRIYAEADTYEKVDRMLDAASAYLGV